jgi:hypothetical protein
MACQACLEMMVAIQTLIKLLIQGDHVNWCEIQMLPWSAGSPWQVRRDKERLSASSLANMFLHWPVGTMSLDFRGNPCTWSSTARSTIETTDDTMHRDEQGNVYLPLTRYMFPDMIAMIHRDRCALVQQQTKKVCYSNSVLGAVVDIHLCRASGTGGFRVGLPDCLIDKTPDGHSRLARFASRVSPKIFQGVE